MMANLTMANIPEFETSKGRHESYRVVLPIKRSTLLYRLTHDLLPTYKRCNPSHRFCFQVPRRVLTHPKEPLHVNSLDNSEANLICSVGDRLSGSKGGIFTIVDILGQGTFGQVFKCQGMGKTTVAIKVIKNKPAYLRQAQSEIHMLRLLNEMIAARDSKHVVRLLEHFTDKGHLCLVFELLDMNLYELLKQNQFRGLPLSLIRIYVRQILEAMQIMEEAGVIHCDLKPENILLVGSGVKSKVQMAPGCSASQSPRSQNQIKVIDFGSACFEGRTMYTYIQSRFYRSPEVLLGLPYDGGIDVWSFGCICAEMFLGLPIFPGVSEHNQLSRIVEMLGAPPDFMLEHGSNTVKYFKHKHHSHPPTQGRILFKVREVSLGLPILEDDVDSGTGGGANQLARLDGLRHPMMALGPGEKASKALSSVTSTFALKTAEEYATDTGTPVVNSKKYFKHRKLPDIVRSCPYGRKLQHEDIQKEDEDRRAFLGFVLGLLEINPWKRWTAKQAADHPFCHGEGLQIPGHASIQDTAWRQTAHDYEPPFVNIIPNRRLQAMLTAYRKHSTAKDTKGDAGSGSGRNVAASPVAYLTAAALSLGQVPPSLQPPSSDPIDISDMPCECVPSPESPSTPTCVDSSAIHKHAFGDNFIHSAPHVYRTQAQPTRQFRRSTIPASALRARPSGSESSNVGVTGPQHAASRWGGRVRGDTADASFLMKGAGSYTHENAERLPSDFGYALQRPGVMVPASPQQQTAFMDSQGGSSQLLTVEAGAHGRRQVPTSNSRNVGSMGSSPYSISHGQQHHISDRGSDSTGPAVSASALFSGVRSPPPAFPLGQAQVTPIYQSAAGHSSHSTRPPAFDPPTGTDEHGVLQETHTVSPSLDGDMADWDPFFADPLEEEVDVPQEGPLAGGSRSRTSSGHATPQGRTIGTSRDWYSSPKRAPMANGHYRMAALSPSVVHNSPKQHTHRSSAERPWPRGAGGPPRPPGAASASLSGGSPPVLSHISSHHRAQTWQAMERVHPSSAPDSYGQLPPPYSVRTMAGQSGLGQRQAHSFVGRTMRRQGEEPGEMAPHAWARRVSHLKQQVSGQYESMSDWNGHGPQQGNAYFGSPQHYGGRAGLPYEDSSGHRLEGRGGMQEDR